MSSIVYQRQLKFGNLGRSRFRWPENNKMSDNSKGEKSREVEIVGAGHGGLAGWIRIKFTAAMIFCITLRSS